MQVVNHIVNETGLAEIRSFLSEYHRLGGAHFTHEMLLAWAADAERHADEGLDPYIELRSFDNIQGFSRTFTVSSKGVDARVTDIE